MLLRAKVPRPEVLKRADLFITECGVASINETIKCGVPIVGIPLQADEHLMACHCCDQLNIGVRLDATRLKTYDIGDAIDQVLANAVYRAKADEILRMSAKYNGAVDAAKMILSILVPKSTEL